MDYLQVERGRIIGELLMYEHDTGLSIKLNRYIY